MVDQSHCQCLRDFSLHQNFVKPPLITNPDRNMVSRPRIKVFSMNPLTKCLKFVLWTPMAGSENSRHGKFIFN